MARSAAGRSWRAASKKISKIQRVTGARLTRTADRLEQRLPRRFQPRFRALRRYSPLSFPGFVMHKFKQDPGFFVGFGAASALFSNAQIPVLLAAGVAPAKVVLVRLLTGVPLDLGVIAWRQHSLRQDKRQPFTGTLKGLVAEYRDYVADQRRQNRRYGAETLRQTPAAAPSTAF